MSLRAKDAPLLAVVVFVVVVVVVVAVKGRLGGALALAPSLAAGIDAHPDNDQPARVLCVCGRDDDGRLHDVRASGHVLLQHVFPQQLEVCAVAQHRQPLCQHRHHLQLHARTQRAHLHRRGLP